MASTYDQQLLEILVSEIKELRSDMKELHSEVVDLHVEVGRLKVKSSLWGALTGFLSALGLLLLKKGI